MIAGLALGTTKSEAGAVFIAIIAHKGMLHAGTGTLEGADQCPSCSHSWLRVGNGDFGDKAVTHGQGKS